MKTAGGSGGIPGVKLSTGIRNSGVKYRRRSTRNEIAGGKKFKDPPELPAPVGKSGGKSLEFPPDLPGRPQANPGDESFRSWLCSWLNMPIPVFFFDFLSFTKGSPG